MQEEFDQAIRNGDVEKIKRLLDDNTFRPKGSIWIACCYNKIEVLKLFLSDPRINPTVEDLKWGIIRSADHDHGTPIVKLLLEDKRVNPESKDGIRIKFEYFYKTYDIVVFDDVAYRVENEDADSIRNPHSREKYLLWLYRIGGEKWAQAKENLK